MVGEQEFDGSVSNEGLTAHVVFQEDKVILTPSIGSSPDKLSKKIQNEKKFQELTVGVPSLHQPRILTEDQKLGRYEIERAIGFNLTSMRGQVQGGGMVDFFHIPISFKAEAMLTYLRAIDAVNQAGYCFVDHKPDSIFIDPQNQQISIVDTDALTEQKNGAWEREIKGGLEEVLTSFFTRNIGWKDSWTLIPAGINIVTSKLSDYKSAHEVIAVLGGWMQGKKTIAYGLIDIKPKEHFELLSRPLKSFKSEVETKIKSADYEHLTDFKRDLLESEIYTALLYESEEPQSLDRYSLRLQK